MNENPPPANEIAAVLPQFKYLGLELGKKWTPQSTNPIILDQMRTAAAQIGSTMVAVAPLGGLLKNGWIVPPPNFGNAGTDYLTRAAVAVVGLTGNIVDEAIYFGGYVDSNGQPLTGAKAYSITFKAPYPYISSIPPGFWSVTMYDLQGYTISNPINRYKLGTGDDLRKNADGSFTLYLQNKDPGGDKQSNWLPSPDGPFFLIIRNYAPVDAVAKGLKDPATFQAPPPVVPLGS